MATLREVVEEAAQVTVVVVPRDRFSRSRISLERLYELTSTPFELVYVDGNSPRHIARYLRTAAATHGFRLLRSDRYISPNHARNLGLAEIDTPYVVFVDNDLDVSAGWLDALLRCAEETGAWAVGPLYLEPGSTEKIIHMAGGDIEMTGEPGSRSFDALHRHQSLTVREAPELRREPCDFVEFHCVLVRRDVFDRIGPLDEALLATREHLDLCLRIRAAGGQVWFEPASVVTFVGPPPMTVTDIPYYWLRWSDAWAHTSLEHFCETYGIEPSYVDRLHIMRRRRQAAFDPLRRFTRRLLGRRAERLLDRALLKGEPMLNRVFVRSADPSARSAA